jgi:hypothetical protein
MAGEFLPPRAYSSPCRIFQDSQRGRADEENAAAFAGLSANTADIDLDRRTLDYRHKVYLLREFPKWRVAFIMWVTKGARHNTLPQ